MLGAWTGRHTFLFPSTLERETRLASLRWEHMYVERKWLCVESYSVFFYLLQSRLVLVSAGESARGRARVHGAYFDVVDFFDHSRGRMPT